MLISDSGFIVSQKKFSENLMLIGILSKNNGLIKGLTRISRKKKFFLFENVEFDWKSKNLNNLGYLKIETNYNSFSLDEGIYSLLIKASISELCIIFLANNENNQKIYKQTSNIINFLSENVEENYKSKCKEYIFFEINFLENIGYGLDCSKCVVSGSSYNLKYISPKSGCAVSETNGAPYKKKLLNLPNFFLDQKKIVEPNELCDGFRVTTFFLNKAKKEMEINKKKNMIFRKEILKKIEAKVYR